VPDESRGGIAAPRRRAANGAATAITVRRAGLADLEQVAAMRLALLQEEAGNLLFAHPHPAARARALRLTRRQLATPGQVFFVAARGDRLVGMLRCRAVRRTPLVVDSRQAVVTTAYVTPQERRRGVLRALLRAADQWCRANDLAGMRVHCAIGNAGGRSAWESLGFVAAELLYLRGVSRA
jgi:GNAT superfamily N-acetyltransferase